MSLSVEGCEVYKDFYSYSPQMTYAISYTFVLNKYKYFATYEVRSAKQPPQRRDLFLLFHSAECLEAFWGHLMRASIPIRSI